VAGACARIAYGSAAGVRSAFPREDNPSPALAAAVTERVWACVVLQWDWLGGAMPQCPAFVNADDRADDRVGARAA